MLVRQVKGVFGGAVAGVMAAAGLNSAAAQEDDDIFDSLGENIRSTVLDAVGSSSDDAGSDDGGISGGDAGNTTEVVSLDDTPGASIADASGGDSNFSFVS